MSKVAKKVFASVSDQLAERLEQRAEMEGRSLSSLISYLLEREMEDWQQPSSDRGGLEPKSKKDK